MRIDTGIRPPRNVKQLRAMLAKSTAGREYITHEWYDTRTYTDNTTTDITFFATAQNDASLSNMPVGGQLTAPQHFLMQYVTLDVVPTAATAFVTTAAGGVAGILDDLGIILVAGRGFWTFELQNKTYGPYPVQSLHGTGGPIGFGWGTFTAEESLQYANNSVPDGGWCVGNSILIPPQAGFSLNMRWPAVLNLTADYRLRVGLHGLLYRAVA